MDKWREAGVATDKESGHFTHAVNALVYETVNNGV